jgi:2OG-Fe(II) oxygenase superfamily
MSATVPTIPAFAFDRAALLETAARLGPAYRVAAPFPHTVIDDFLPAPVAEGVLAEFPAVGDIEWRTHDNPRERKLGASHDDALGPFTRQVLAQFNAGMFIDFLEELTGIGGLIPDPHLVGGGLHQIVPGGYLKVHADFNRHPRLNLDRRLNLLLYLNHDWPESYGGHLELWDRDMHECVQRVLPVFNRCVIFSTTSFSHHGHPHPLTCPEGRTRRSLALYYYSNGRPESEILAEDHSTLFRDIPGEHVASDAPAAPRARTRWWQRR